jgi:hypothetical protein
MLSHSREMEFELRKLVKKVKIKMRFETQPDHSFFSATEQSLAEPEHSGALCRLIYNISLLNELDMGKDSGGFILPQNSFNQKGSKWRDNSPALICEAQGLPFLMSIE